MPRKLLSAFALLFPLAVASPAGAAAPVTLTFEEQHLAKACASSSRPTRR